MITGADIVLLLIISFVVLYLAFLSIMALVARRLPAILPVRYRRFAVVVPAADEEMTIERTVQSLLSVDYPRECFSVIVIADNCSDRTAEISTSAGAIVYERRNSELRGKGYALRWCFDLLLSDKNEYDAIVVVDADSVVSRNFLNVMNSYLEKGAQAIQSSYLVVPQPNVWSVEVTRLGFTLYNLVRPLGRRLIGCSAGLRGNGMCFAIDTLRRVPWEAYSLVEDLEFGLTLLLNGVTVTFAPEATVNATMPARAENAYTQRARWEIGRYPIIIKYAGRLLWTAIKQRSFKALDAFMGLVTPPLMNLSGLLAAFLLLNMFLWLFGAVKTELFIWLCAALVGVDAFHVLVGLRAAHADRSLYKALLYVPRYGIWKFGVYWKVLWRASTWGRWVRTPRERTRL
jgi:1,2-diacylglycerol 3-beta-glucosyltransferase